MALGTRLVPPQFPRSLCPYGFPHRRTSDPRLMLRARAHAFVGIRCSYSFSKHLPLPPSPLGRAGEGSLPQKLPTVLSDRAAGESLSRPAFFFLPPGSIFPP